MALTFQDVIDALVNTVQRDDQIPYYLGYANGAVRELARMHSFLQMKAVGTGSVSIGQTRATLPSDFKELQNGRYPISDSVGGASASLVPVFTRSEVEKLLPVGLVAPTTFIYTQGLSGGTSAYYLDLAAPATAAHTLTVYYFAYPSYATDTTQTTPLITYYFDLVREKALSLAFAAINDPVYMLHERQFLTEFSQQTGEDVRQALAALNPAKE